MSASVLERNARNYAELLELHVDFESPLGYGNDGTVWKTSRRTANKAIERKSKYDLELFCYQRLAEEGVASLDEFAVPELIGNSDELLVIEMTIVSPPYIVDFAKVWLDKEPDFPEDAVEERLRRAEDDFGDDWPAVARLLWTLKTRFGIYYTDPNLGKIKVR